MQKLFYQNYRKLNGSVDPEESKYDINKAITLHPFKNHTYLYKMQQYTFKQKLINLQKKEKRLEKDISILENLISSGLQGSQIENKHNNNAVRKLQRHLVKEWTCYKGKSYFSHVEINPKHAIEEPDLKLLIQTIFESEKHHTEKIKTSGQIFYVKGFEHGYKHISPDGIEFLLYLKVCCLNGNHGKSVDNRMYQAMWNLSSLHVLEDRTIDENLYLAEKKLMPVINFIIPLSGKLSPFLKFVNNFKKLFLQQGKRVSLVIVLFWDIHNQRESWEVVLAVKQLKQHFPNYVIQLIQRRGQFNRGIALNIGASIFNDDDLLFFIDVDCFIHPSILKRIIFNTIQNEQAYFPIMFSLYNPKFVWQNDANFDNFTFSEEKGFWRFHSFGQLSIFKSDFSHIGGYDSNIRGWGKEDINLFQKFLDKGTTPFRAPDPGLIHIFHFVQCGLELPHEQYRMCLGTKWSTFGCQKVLSDIVYTTKNIFGRNKDFE